MARIGRLDVGFSTKDQDLWDCINQFPERDRSYWLKYYAMLGIGSASKGNSSVSLVPTRGIKTESNNPPRRRNNKNTEVEVPQVVQSNSEINSSTDSEEASPIKPIKAKIEKKSVDPAEIRRRAMENFLAPDEDVLKALALEKEKS